MLPTFHCVPDVGSRRMIVICSEFDTSLTKVGDVGLLQGALAASFGDVASPAKRSVVEYEAASPWVDRGT